MSAPDSDYSYDRDELIAICEAARVPMAAWHNRDSARSQEGVGRAWALLSAGCPFTVLTSGDYCVTDDETIWIEIEWRGFRAFEWGDEGLDRETFYLPTRKRLEEAGGRDWY